MSANAWQRQYRALMRLQLYMVGKTHEIVGGLADQARAVVLDAAAGDGKLTPSGLFAARTQLNAAWASASAQWQELLSAGMREAASIPFGTLSELHGHWIGVLGRRAAQGLNAGERRKEQKRRGLHEQSEPDFVFRPQLDAVMQAANQRIYADGLRLSQRIWRFDQQSRSGLESAVFAGVQQGNSAWDIAKRMEQYLGAGRNCPRWTSTRLYRLTKKDIASGDPRGLLRGEECDGRGVAYNALRLARTEIQAVHNLATQRVMAAMPWVEKEQMNLSPAHPVSDVCDEIIARGEDGRGIYPKGTLSLPIHPNCLCYLTAVDMPADAFVERMRGWLQGAHAWPEMDGYARGFGNALEPSVSGLSRRPSGLGLSGLVGAAGLAIIAALVDWLAGDKATLDGRMAGGAA
jgi:hypothetical protein